MASLPRNESASTTRRCGWRPPKRTQAAILAAAKRVFEERGWAGATVRLIAQEAAVSQKTVEALYGTKLRSLCGGGVRDSAVPAADPEASGDERHEWCLLVVGDADEREQCRLVSLLHAFGLLDGARPRFLGHAARRHPLAGARPARARERASGPVDRRLGGASRRSFSGGGPGRPRDTAYGCVPAPGDPVAGDRLSNSAPSGISAGTWLLILGELSCWTIFGLHELDPRLITLGFTGVTASILMLARLRYANRLHAPVAARHA